MRASLDVTRLHAIEAIPRRIERTPEGWRFHFSSGDSQTARFVIDASGRAALVARRFGTPRRLDRLIAASAVVQREPHGADWAAVGDAAATLDPLGSHGLSVALWSGERVASAALAAVNGDGSVLETSAAALSRGLARFASASVVHYGAEGRFPDAPFWQRRR